MVFFKGNFLNIFEVERGFFGATANQRTAIGEKKKSAKRRIFLRRKTNFAMSNHYFDKTRLILNVDQTAHWSLKIKLKNIFYPVDKLTNLLVSSISRKMAAAKRSEKARNEASRQKISNFVFSANAEYLNRLIENA